MKTWNKSLALLMLVPFSLPAAAQENEDELDKRMLEAEQRLTEEEQREMQRAAEVLAREAEELVRAQELQGEEVDVRMREAERRMAEAAQQMAELSMRQLPQIERIERVIRANRGPALGVTIGADSEGRPVEGVEVLGVTPGGAAEEAGLRAGDVITSINGESFSADDSSRATKKLIEFMQGVEEGDELDVEYLRDGNTATVALAPRPMENNVFAFSFGEDGMKMPGQDFDVHIAPGANKFNSFVWAMHDDYRHLEGNSAAHIKSSLFGASETLVINQGKPVLGTWQGIYFCEFDGPRQRRVHIQIIGR